MDSCKKAGFSLSGSFRSPVRGGYLYFLISFDTELNIFLQSESKALNCKMKQIIGDILTAAFIAQVNCCASSQDLTSGQSVKAVLVKVVLFPIGIQGNSNSSRK